jgi:hypothetical protein
VRQRDATPSALGFTVKSGWASAVLVTESDGSPKVEDSRRVELSDPGIPGSRQPYHAGFGTARGGGPELARLIASVEQFGTRSVGRLLEQWQIGRDQLGGVGLVVGSLVDPDSLANPHIRIHALEGRLFRRVVEDGAKRVGLLSSVWRERDLYATAPKILGRSEQQIRDVLRDLRRTVVGSWRAEEKTAALAAWLVLAGEPQSEPVRRRRAAKGA